ncbi:MAG: galactose oxidase-like domain-containing protein [Granulosicoccus sp.]
MKDQIGSRLRKSVGWCSAHLFSLTLILGLIVGTKAVAQDHSYAVEFVDARTEVTSLAQSINLLDNPGTLARTTRFTDTLNFAEGGAQGEFHGDLVFPYGDFFAVRARRNINVIDAGTYTLGVNSDDGVRLAVDGTVIINDDVLRAPENSFASLFLSAGAHSIEVVYFENWGGASLELFAASGTHHSMNSNFELLRGGLSMSGVLQPSTGQFGQWGPVIDWPLVAVSMANLPDGRILTYSGSERRTWPTSERTYSATWDPLTGQFDETLHMGHNMFCAATSMTADGKVFVNGGRNEGNSPWTSVFDHTTSNWTQIENMASGGRWYPTTLALGNGKIMTAMGSSTNVRNPDLWSEDTGWRVLNGIDFLDMRQRRNERGSSTVFPLLSQAPNGMVYHFWDTIENHYIDPTGNGRAVRAEPDTDHGDHAGGSQLMYDEGRLLITGTNDGSWGNDNSSATSNAFTIDLNGSRPLIRETQSMNYRRKFHQMIPLPTGEVLVVGGNTSGAKFQDNGSVLSAEIWNPDTGAFRAAAKMSIPRDYHSTALLMPDGRVITAGGGYHWSDPNSGGTHEDAQIYSPPYLFGDDGQAAARPTIQSSVDEIGYGQTFSVTTSGDVAFFSLIRMSSVTHAVNTDVRMFKPEFAEQANGLFSITMHSNENVATPGYWMLFAVDTDGVPSSAETIRIAADVEPQDPNNGNPAVIAEIVSSPVEAGSDTSFEADATGFDLTYNWNFGDGTGDSGFTSNNSISHRFAAPGRYIVSVTVRTPAGDESVQTFTQVVHGSLDADQPVASSTLVEVVSRSELWNVNPDNNSVGIVGTDIYDVLDVVQVGRNPSALALAPDGRVWVVNKADATVSILNTSSRSVERTLTLDKNSLPHGIVFNQHSAYIALEGTATVVQLDAVTGNERRRSVVGNFPRHLSLNATGDTLYVSSFITPALPGENGASPSVSGQGGQVHVFTTSTTTLRMDRVILMGHSNRATSESSGPGLPNYLGPVLISPDGTTAMVPSKQDNILRGMHRNGLPLVFDQTVRAITSVVNLDTQEEILSSRVDHDNASVASHGAYGPYGLTFFTSLEGNRQVALIDTETNIEYARFDTGFAPQSVLMSSSGNQLFVHHFMDRSVGVYDVSDVVNRGETVVSQIAVVNVTDGELLSSTAFRGKQLFYDARDDRLAALDYMSCASCHNEAGHDGRNWDFTNFGEGIRNTPSLIGKGGTRNGLLHWSANFDEIQDFEGQIRGFAGGTGLMSDDLFNQGTRAQSLGDPKAGLSPDLDALADYLQSLNDPLPSPYRDSDGSLSNSAERGKTLFASKGCADCHSGSSFTDSSATLNLHDIGTLDSDSGKRLNASLAGIDTPMLPGAWHTAPYLHDGSAATLENAIVAHDGVSLTISESEDLAEFVRQVSPTDSITQTPDGVSNLATGLSLDGELDEWANLISFGIDPDDVAGDNDPLDWREAWMAHDSDTLYIAYRNDGPIEGSWGQTLYIDTDSSSGTGYRQGVLGADVLIQERYVYRYAGDGSNWSWTLVTTMPGDTTDTTAEYSVSRNLLGNPASIRLAFVGSNEAYPGGTQDDYYPDGVYDDVASVRYFDYLFSVSGPAAPVANNISLSTSTGEAVSIMLTGSDPNNDPLTYSVVTQPVNGSLSGVAPDLVYTPDPGFSGVDSIGFVVNDGSVDSAAATVSIAINFQDGYGGVVSNYYNALLLDGAIGDWSQLQSFGIDPDDISDTGAQIDYVQAWMAHDDEYFYVAYRGDGQNFMDVDAWGFNLYMDTDKDAATGYTDTVTIGADYLLQGASLFRYTGDGFSWSWEYLGDAERFVDASASEIRFPRSSIGNTTRIDLVFVGDNLSIGGAQNDTYPDAAANGQGSPAYFMYSTEDTVADDSSLLLSAATAEDSTPRNSHVEATKMARQPTSSIVNAVASESTISAESGASGGSNVTVGSGCSIHSGQSNNHFWLLLLLASFFRFFFRSAGGHQQDLRLFAVSTAQ